MRTGILGICEARERLGAPLQAVLEPYGGLGGLSILHSPPEGITDNPIRILIRSADGSPTAVLSCSKATHPRYIAQENGAARQAKSRLGRRLGRVILEPLLSGELDGRSYTVVPWRCPLSTSRVMRRIQCTVLGPRLLRWLRRATQATLAVPGENDIEPLFLEPLNHIARHAYLTHGVRQRATAARDRLVSGEWQPRNALDHNDLWLGNILLDSSRPGCWGLTKRFVIVDWRGANPSGYGMYDLLRLANSVGIGSSRLARELGQHCEILGCSLSDSMSQLLAGLGHLGMNLECFPVDRYVALVERCYQTLSEVVER